MTSVRIGLVFRFVVLWGLTACLSTGLANAQDVGAPPNRQHGNWDKVKQLSVGREILVVENDAKSFQGKLQSVSDESITIRLTTGEETLAKGNILRVSSRGVSHRWRNVGLGAGIGAGGGAGIGAAAENATGFGWSRGLSAAVGAVIGLAAGAAVGAALPTGGWHEVYRAH
jgi:outer membrane lipoprotein SlyB